MTKKCVFARSRKAIAFLLLALSDIGSDKPYIELISMYTVNRWLNDSTCRIQFPYCDNTPLT